MKSLKDVEKTRVAYHRDPMRDTVHRSSLLVPEIPGAIAEISFLNHFLLKRGYPNVACRVTAIDAEGRRIASRLHPVTEPRVYRFQLTDSFDEAADTYMVEFFAAENLFIPFPAVMVNHRSDRFLNTVHAFNRVLNDVFEDDAINADIRPEASIDVAVGKDRDTFALFMTGPAACRGELEMQFETPEHAYRQTVPLDAPRLSRRFVSLRETFPQLSDGDRGTLRIRQPRQPLFYGRMLAGIRLATGEFSANHSYYDCSDSGEYWEDGSPSYRVYPRLPGYGTRLRMYPIQSPSRLGLSVAFHDDAGRELGRAEAGELATPGRAHLDVPLEDCAAGAGVDPARIAAFALHAQAREGKVPTRTNHQLSYSRGGLESSINLSLMNRNTFRPEGKPGFTWGQVPLGGPVSSSFGVVGDAPGGEAADVEISVYGERGHLGDLKRPLPASGAAVFDARRDLGPLAGALDELSYLWVVARSRRPDISFFCVSGNDVSGHCSGEHGF